MSHFTVLVVTDARPSEEELAAVLQPWHEYECTGIDDQYVVDVDCTQDALAAFAKAKVVRMKGPDGTLHDRVQSAAEWISDYYGLPIQGTDPETEARRGRVEVDASGLVVRCVERTNPHKKWDWWQLGGRWSGLLRVKEGALALSGRPGLFGARSSDHPLSADQALVRDIDFETLRAEARAEAYELWDSVQAIVSRHPPFEDWETLRDRSGGKLDAARDIFWAQPAVAALRDAFKDSWGLDIELQAARMDRAAYAQMRADGAFVTFAVVKDGRWYERGEMGWWGCVTDEKDEASWTREFAKLIDGLPGDACLSVVDCHI